MAACQMLVLVALVAATSASDTEDLPISVPTNIIDPQAVHTPDFGPGGGWDASESSYIIGGHRVQPGSHPYTCFLKTTYPSGMWGLCGAVLYNEVTLLTAAHCLEGSGYNTDIMTVTCGEYNLFVDDGTEQIKNIIDAVWHRGYNKTGKLENDIAMIKVDSPFVINDFVKPIELATENENRLSDCFLLGWGRISSTDPSAFDPVLKETSTYIMQPEFCTANYWSFASPKQICFMNFANMAGSCKGDSGGPAVCGGKLVGLTSYGADNCPHWIPQVYVRVRKYAKWIAKKAWEVDEVEGSGVSP